MNKHEIARKLIKMAKSLLGYRSDPTITGLSSELADVDEVVIIITDAPLHEDMSRLASKSRITRYSLDEVKALLSGKRIRYEFVPREDGKSNPINIDMDYQEALDVILHLTLANYNAVLSSHFVDTDVYTVKNYVRKNNKEPIDLYIKFYLEEDKKTKKVFIISFHKEEY